jgi:hypothetical protein
LQEEDGYNAESDLEVGAQWITNLKYLTKTKESKNENPLRRLCAITTEG